MKRIWFLIFFIFSSTDLFFKIIFHLYFFLRLSSTDLFFEIIFY